VTIGLSAGSRTEVDELVDRAFAAGGEEVGAQDQGLLYMKAFRDLEGHQRSSIFVDPAAFGEG
jgi:predicted lactoylglutathione lyase